MPAPKPNANRASRLKTRHLLLLVRLAEHASLVGAAHAANMSQPAASRLLGEMEALLRVPLFERHARGVTATRYGESLIRHARLALADIERAHEDIAALRDGRVGNVAIGTVVNPGTHLLPRAIAALKQHAPGIEVRVDMDYSRPLVSKLRDGVLDLVIGRILDPQGVDELDFEPLADEPHALIARTRHPLLRKQCVRHADLLSYGWVVPPANSMLRAQWTSMFVERALRPPQNLVETSALPVTTSLLRQTDMLAALPAEAVADLVQARLLGVVPIDLGLRMGHFGIITRRRALPSPAGKIFLDCLRDAARVHAAPRARPRKGI